MPSDARVRPGEQGSTLLLFPVGILVVIILGAVAVDLAVVFMGEREVANVAAAVANDAAGALDEEAFYTRGEIRIDLARARTLLTQALAQRVDPSLSDLDGAVRLPSPDEVEVTIRARVPLVFAPGLPGSDRLGQVEATSRAVAAQR